MKNKFILFFATITLSLIISSCDNDSGFENGSSLAIVKTLPKMYIDKLQKDETRVINTKKEFDQLFTEEDLEKCPVLNEFLEASHTLLIGRFYHTYQVNISHAFESTGKRNYLYSLNVLSTDATAIDDFVFGIIVEKLPEGANIKFKVEYTKPN